MPRASESAPAKRKTPARSTRAKKAPADPALRLTGARIVVRTAENGERKSASGLLIPATAMPAPKRLTWGNVTLVGPEVRVTKAGDRVLFLPSAALEVEIEGEELVLLRERDVQAVSEAPAGGSRAERAPGQYL